MTPEQFKALGLKEGDTVRITIEGRVTSVKPEAAQPLRTVDIGGNICWPMLNGVRSIEVVETPLAVGDRIWHKSGAFGESQPIVALVDVGDVPHLVCPGWGVSDGALVCGPVADYVRAKA